MTLRSIFAQSKTQGDYHHHLLRDLELGDGQYYKRFLPIIGMTPDMLEEILPSCDLFQHDQETNPIH